MKSPVAFWVTAVLMSLGAVTGLILIKLLLTGGTICG